MAHVGTQLTPLRVGTAIAELDEVEAVVDVRLQVTGSHMHTGSVLIVVLILASQADIQDRQRLGTNILRQAEQLIEAHAIGLEVVGEQAVREGVVPTVLVHRTVFNSAHRVLPLIARSQIGSLYDATTGEAEYAGMQILQVLYEVGTQTTLPSIGGEERHVIEVDSIAALQIDAHEAFGIGARRGDLGGVLLPVLAGNLHRFLGHHLIIITNEFNANLCIAVCTGINREFIGKALLQTHTEIAMILQTCELLTMSVVGKRHIVRISVEGRTLRTEFHIAEHIPALQSTANTLTAGRDVKRSLKRAVLHQLCIESTIGTEVNILEEDTVHRRLYGSPRFRVEYQLALSLCCSESGKSHQCHSKNLFTFHYD